MPRSVVQLFQTKLGAVGLFVEGITDAADRVRHSALQADTSIAFLQHEKTTKTERDNCMAMVVNDARLEDDDRRRLLEAIAESKKARQDGQKWSPQILNIFTRTDWDNWKSRGAEQADDTLDEMIIRSQHLGGNNIAETVRPPIAISEMEARSTSETYCPSFILAAICLPVTNFFY